MTTRLYVANLPFDATEDAVRAHFAACGGVSDVELPPERGGKKTRGQARVTMTSPAFALAAVAQLDRVAFEGKLLRVSQSPLTAEATAVEIVQQFRERGSMVYDVDCAGMPLTVRVHAVEGERWSIEARSTESSDAAVVRGSGATRRDALDAVLRAWNARAELPRFDADGLLRALSDVRAI